MVLALVLACAAMALKDSLGVGLVVAEARGRAWLAGVLDALSDLAIILVTLAGAGAVIVHGWTLRTGVILAAMMLTSFLGTAAWTRLARRIKAHA
jgi:hypothetical protein